MTSCSSILAGLFYVSSHLTSHRRLTLGRSSQYYGCMPTDRDKRFDFKHFCTETRSCLETWPSSYAGSMNSCGLCRELIPGRHQRSFVYFVRYNVKNVCTLMPSVNNHLSVVLECIHPTDTYYCKRKSYHTNKYYSKSTLNFPMIHIMIE